MVIKMVSSSHLPHQAPPFILGIRVCRRVASSPCSPDRHGTIPSREDWAASGGRRPFAVASCCMRLAFSHARLFLEVRLVPEGGGVCIRRLPAASALFFWADAEAAPAAAEVAASVIIPKMLDQIPCAHPDMKTVQAQDARTV